MPYSRRSHRRRDDSHSRRERRRSTSHRSSRHRPRHSSRHSSSHRSRRRKSPSTSSSTVSSSSSSEEETNIEINEPKQKMIDPITQTTIFPIDTERMSIKEKMHHQTMITANPSLTRLSRRIYVGNVPPDLGLTEEILLDFFTVLLKFHGINTPQAVLSCWLSDPPAFCFLDMRSVSDTTKTLTYIENLKFGSHVLKIGRPPDYSPAPVHLSNFVVGALPIGLDISKKIIDPAAHKTKKSLPQTKGNRKINVPFPVTSGTRIKEPLMPVKIRPTIDGGTIVSPAFPEDAEKLKKSDPTSLKADQLFTNLNEPLREVFISALPATANIEPSLLDIDVLPSRPCPPSLVIVIENMVKADELVNETEYHDILYDVRFGAQRYGEVADVVIPRPGVAPGEFGVGRVFVEYTSVKSAMNAYKYMPRRKFLGRKLEVKYYEEYKYKSYIF